MAAMLFSLLATPALLVIGHRWVLPQGARASEARLFGGLGAFLYRRRRPLAAVIVLVALASGAGWSRVYFQDSWIDNFSRRSSVRVAERAMNEKLLGTLTLQVQIDTGKRGGVKDADLLKRIEAFQGKVNRLDGVGGSVSVCQIVRKMHREFAGRDDPGAPGPESSAAIAQYLFLLEGGSHAGFWSPEYRKTLVTVFVKSGDYITGCRVLDKITRYLREDLPDCRSIIGGDHMLSYQWVQLVQQDQRKTLLAALAMVFAASAAFLGSLRKGLGVLGPVVLAVALNFGVMGFGGMPIGVTSSMLWEKGDGAPFRAAEIGLRPLFPPGNGLGLFLRA